MKPITTISNTNIKYPHPLHPHNTMFHYQNLLVFRHFKSFSFIFLVNGDVVIIHVFCGSHVLILVLVSHFPIHDLDILYPFQGKKPKKLNWSIHALKELSRITLTLVQVGWKLYHYIIRESIGELFSNKFLKSFHKVLQRR